MKLARLSLLADGMLAPCSNSNPFRFGGSTAPSILVGVKPEKSQPVRPLLDGLAPDECPDRQPDPIGSIDRILLRLILAVLVLILFVCGLGVQHIGYIRRKSDLSRQIRQRELELRALTQAYHSLEFSLASKSADDFRRVWTYPVAAKPPPRKEPSRG